MMLSKFKVVAATIVAVAASVLLAAPADAGKKAAPDVKPVTPSPNSVKFEPGVWVAKVVGTPAQWTYVLSTDPSGRHAVGYGIVDVGFYDEALDEATDKTSPLLIDVVMTGPGIAKFNSVWYGIKDEPAEIMPGLSVSGHIVYIGVNRGEMRTIAPGKSEGTHNICYYDPVTSDSDLDGLPDAGATALYCVPTFTTVDTRLGQ
jgi:hypothetical protein